MVNIAAITYGFGNRGRAGGFFTGRQNKNSQNQANELIISFWEKLDIKALENAVTIVSQNQNIHLEITGFKFKEGRKRLEITVEVPSNLNKDQLKANISKQYDQQTKERESNGNANYYIFQMYNGDINMFNNFEGANVGNVAHTVKDNAQQQANFNINPSGQRQTLAEAAAEIQRLLKQLEETNSTATDAEQIAYVNISTKPDFKQRAIAALKEGGETAIEEFFLENKYLKVGKAIIKGWLQGNT